MDILLNIMYVLSGLVSFTTGIYAFLDKKHSKRIGTGLFWVIFGLLFIFGPYINPTYVGMSLLFLGILTVTKNVSFGSQINSSDEYRKEQSKKIGNKIFIPALSIGLVAFSVAQFTKLGGLVGLGIGSVTALFLTFFYTKEEVKYVGYDSSRLLQQMGAAVILPQLLGALGALFTKAGIGTVISTAMIGIVPEGSKIGGIIIYCTAMVVFTMIMGNAFAAFAVITVGIGVPFLVNIGANPAYVGALGLTTGYCGTLLTPMAANFNIVPTTILEMKNRNGIILTQFPIALSLILIQMILMYFLAF
jgi:uncharacterized membrane protein